MQPNRIDDPGHPDLRQHPIPPAKTRTDRVLPNPDISRVTDSPMHRPMRAASSGLASREPGPISYGAAAYLGKKGCLGTAQKSVKPKGVASPEIEIEPDAWNRF